MNGLFIFVIATALVGGTTCSVLREIFECDPGLRYTQNHCNSCYCIGSNDFVCTEMKKCTDIQKECATGSTWYEECNKCWCTNAGIVCTTTPCT